MTGQLDWELRFMKMQQHTGEHIVSGIVREHYGYENVGFIREMKTVRWILTERSQWKICRK